MGILLCDGPLIPSCYVHWCNDLNTSVACPGETLCTLHTRQAIWKGYAPVLLHRHRWQYGRLNKAENRHFATRFDGQLWWRRALELTQNTMDICEVGKRGMMFLIQRPDYRRNAPLEIELIDAPPVKLANSLDFDTRPIMENCFAKPHLRALGKVEGEIDES